MSHPSWENLESFIRKEAGMSSKPIGLDMSVVYDLGQEGDDADTFMTRFFEEFGIDEGDYKFEKYFFMEGEGFVYHLIQKYLFRRPHSTKREPLTVRMLRDAMIQGRWDSKILSMKRQ
ncbi:DUF1493 family protein [Paraburkholderia sp. MMS20-SJTR3]|uniref:DUF1493 family protein n=1 Tax=Paraburkholderia sejongensis TaxID=2886946 RepID=A0ABS8JUK2_9BURK|nr:DUF1493 family protein [Paraburkholderia sp. MMS20-SJTR3]MCC8393567.1 DUF1493 family protein [Paraburkholderia sp. MMS20-SJTR3]